MAPLTSRAQKMAISWRIGALDSADSRGWAGFREGLHHLGLEAGRNVHIEFRWSDSQVESSAIGK